MRRRGTPVRKAPGQLPNAPRQRLSLPLAASATLAPATPIGMLVRFVGEDDGRVERLRGLTTPGG